VHVTVHFLGESMDHFRYPRHFLLLTCFCLLIAVMSRVNPGGSMSVWFASYGVLHASALVLAARARQSLWRSSLFIVSAATLSVVTLHIALLGRPLSEAAPGNVASYLLLGFSAATGAITYGILIRTCGLYALTMGGLAAISIGCMFAAIVALFTARHNQYLGPWWIAALWWYGFSGGLWCFDRRHMAESSEIGR
jgi:hypothetical protein